MADATPNTGPNTGPNASVAGSDRGRLTVELRLAGLLGLIWSFGLVHAMVWIVATVARGQPVGDLPWLALAIPQVVALAVVLVIMVLQLPRERWPRRGSLVRTPSPIPLLLLGFPALIIVPVIVLRDRRARSRTVPLAPDEVEAAFHRLVAVPRVLAMQFLVWMGLAYLANAITLGVQLDWTRGVMAVVAVLWLALLGPLVALIASRGRAILRPEYLTAPRVGGEIFRRTGDLGIKLTVNASIASVGAVAAPLAAGYLWMWSHAADVAAGQARDLAARATQLVAAGEDEALGHLLVENPNLGVLDGARTYGRQLPPDSTDEGPIDVNGDGLADLVIARSHQVTAGVFVDAPQLVPVDLLVFGGIFCLAFSIGGVVLLSRDVRRDVERATSQVDAVSRGAAPPPMTRGSFATRELRQLVRSVDRLVNRITETNVAKYVAIEKAKEADRLKSQFLANMSHDLRSPLNSILGFSELLLTGIDGDLEEDHRPLVQTIHDSGRDLLQQIDDILDTAKIDAGRMEVHAEPTPPATIISRAIQNARKRLRKEIEFVTEAAPGLPPVHVDPYRTVQAVENVLLFASERMESGQITISMRPARGEDGRSVAVQIRTPVPPATADQLRRARQGFTRLPGHVGLGLSLPIASAILELQSGAVDIEDLGEGMLFTLRLPAPEARRTLRLREA